jgi:hypothetical protein
MIEEYYAREENFEDIELDDTLDIEELQEELVAEQLKQNYVDNDLMLMKYIEYQKERKLSLEQGKEEPVIPKYLAECIIKIATHLSYRFNFINYSFREEMQADAIATMVRGFNSFDPERSKYIFSYMTTSAFRSFVRRIQLEEAQTQIKARAIMETNVMDIVTQESENGDYSAEFVEWAKIAQDYKIKPEKIKEKKRLTNIDDAESILEFDED